VCPKLGRERLAAVAKIVFARRDPAHLLDLGQLQLEPLLDLFLALAALEALVARAVRNLLGLVLRAGLDVDAPAAKP
jgi:hypothetical protein